MIRQVTLFLHPSEYRGMSTFLMRYRQQLNTIRLADLLVEEIVLASFIVVWLIRQIQGASQRWQSRRAEKSYSYRLPTEVAKALLLVMQTQFLTDDEQRFLAALDEALLNAGFKHSTRLLS